MNSIALRHRIWLISYSAECDLSCESLKRWVTEAADHYGWAKKFINVKEQETELEKEGIYVVQKDTLTNLWVQHKRFTQLVRQFVKRRQNKEQKAIDINQRSRLSARRPGKDDAFFISSVAAQELFKSMVLMTTNSCDAAFAVNDDPEKPWKPTEKIAAMRSNYSKKGVDKHDQTFFQSSMSRTGKQILFMLTNSAVELVENKTKPFRAFRFCLSNHVVVGLWDVKKNVLEMFDSGGAPKQYAKIYFSMVDLLFRNVSNKPRYKVVNTIDLQTDKSDKFCQTWIYYYIYQRVLVGEPAHRIITKLAKMSGKERLTEILAFWNYISRS